MAAYTLQPISFANSSPLQEMHAEFQNQSIHNVITTQMKVNMRNAYSKSCLNFCPSGFLAMIKRARYLSEYQRFCSIVFWQFTTMSSLELTSIFTYDIRK